MSLAILTALAIHFTQENAEDTFRKLEKSLAEAKSISIKLHGDLSMQQEEGDDRKMTYSGSVRLKSGDRLDMALELSEMGSLRIRSDGKRSRLESPDGIEEKAAERGSFRFFTAVLTRSGFGIMNIGVRKRNQEGEAPDPEKELQVSNFRFAGKETLETGEAVVLKYDVRVFQEFTLKMTLWLDSTTLLPIKRIGTLLDDHRTMTNIEIYEEVSTEEIPDGAFSLSPANSEGAEELFRKFEKTFEEARSVALRFESAVESQNPEDRTTLKGTVRFKKDDRFRIDVQIQSGKSDQRLHLISDGKAMGVDDGEERSVEKTPKGFSAMLVGGITRGGLIVLHRLKAEPGPPPRDVLKVSDFAFGEEERIGSVEAVVLAYTLGVEGHRIQMKLWLEKTRLIPLKRTGVLGGDKEIRFTETYTRVFVDEIPDEDFERE